MKDIYYSVAVGLLAGAGLALLFSGVALRLWPWITPRHLELAGCGCGVVLALVVVQSFRTGVCSCSK